MNILPLRLVTQVLAGGDPLEKFTNRTYKNKKSKAINTTDLDMVTETFKKMKGKPVIVSVQLSNPSVFAEFEKLANAILVNFSVQDQAVLDALTGAVEPSGLLPLQIPANMETVEKQNEDVPHDMECHIDSEGNKYDFAFGLELEGCDYRCTYRKVQEKIVRGKSVWS